MTSSVGKTNRQSRVQMLRTFLPHTRQPACPARLRGGGRLLVSATAVFLVVTGGVGTTAAPVQEAEEQTRTVWDGVYTEEQAARGGERFLTSCARCHGAELQGDNARTLTGEVFEEGFREASVGYLFDYVRENMPSGAGGSLSTNTYIDLVAFILSRNGFPSGTEELTPEAAPGIQIIAESGPGELPTTTLASVVGCLVRGDDGNWLLNSATAPERIEAAAIGDDDATRPLGTRTYSLMFVLTPLDTYVGQRMSVSGLLMGDGGVDGINVTLVESVAESCP